MKYIVLTFLLLGFIALAIFGSLQLKKDITPAGPTQLRVSATSTPTEQFIFIEQDQINQQLQLPIIHRVLTEERKPKGRRTKLRSPNVFVVLPTPTAAGQVINLSALPNNNANYPVQAKFIGPQSEQYWLRFFNTTVPVLLVSQSDGAGGYEWTVSPSNTSPNLKTAATGGGLFDEDIIPDIIDLLEGIPEIKGALEALYEFYTWFNGETNAPDILTNADIIADMEEVINSVILAGIAQNIQNDFHYVNEQLFITLTNNVKKNAANQQADYNDVDLNLTGDIHGVLTNGFTNRTSTYNIANTVANVGTGTFSGLLQSMQAFANINNFTNSSGQNTEPTQWWLSFAQFVGYYLYSIQIMAYFDPTYPGVTTSYTSPWNSQALSNAQSSMADITSGLPQLYRLYYQFINQFQANIQYQAVPLIPGYAGGGNQFLGNYCGYQTTGYEAQSYGCGYFGGPSLNPLPTYYSIVNGNGSAYQFAGQNEGNYPSCFAGNYSPSLQPPLPSNVIGSGSYTDQYGNTVTGSFTCLTTPDPVALQNVRESLTNILEAQWNFPRKMIDNYATVFGLDCQSFSSNQVWSCTVIQSSYSENGYDFPYGSFFGIQGGSASAELSQNGVHLLCSSLTGITLNTSSFYKDFLFEIENFIDFSVSSFDYWDPDFTTNGGCCPPDTAYIRTCWEGSVSESVGSQTNGVKGRRKFWCVTNSVNNQVTTTTDAIPVQVCEAPLIATVSAGLYPFAKTPADGANFSSFFMPSRAMQWYIGTQSGSPMMGQGNQNINPLSVPVSLQFAQNAAASSFAQGPNPNQLSCVPTPEAYGNYNASLVPAASLSGFPKATSTADVPQLAAYAFPCNDIPTPWLIPSFDNGIQKALVTDGTNSVYVQNEAAIDAILNMPQPNFSASFNNFALWGLPSPSATSAINPWVQGTTIFFWDQDKNVLAPGTTVSATSTVTAIVMENQYIQNSGTPRNIDCNSLYTPAVICNSCPYQSAFAAFNWEGYKDSTRGVATFSAPSNWTLQFHYATP